MLKGRKAKPQAKDNIAADFFEEANKEVDAPEVPDVAPMNFKVRRGLRNRKKPDRLGFP